MLIPIPYAADRPLRRFPVVTLFLVGLNCAVFILSLWSGLDYIVGNYGLRALNPEVSTLFTSIVLHAGTMHLLVNVTYLWLFGCLVEDVLGRAEYLLFYVGSGVAGGLLRIFIAKNVLSLPLDDPAVGASGAVAGILGIFAIRFYRARIKTLLVVPMELPSLPAIGFWIGIQMACAASCFFGASSTGAWSHVGGFAFGVVSGLLMNLGREAEDEYLFEDARRQLAARNARHAVRYLDELLRRNPQDPEVHLQLARAFYQVGDQESARVHAQRAVELALSRADVSTAVANYTALTPLGILGHLSLDAEFRIACTLEGQHRLEAAARAYRNVFEHYPGSLEAETALIRCAQVLSRMPRHMDEAEALYRDYLEQYPEGEWRSFAESSVRR